MLASLIASLVLASAIMPLASTLCPSYISGCTCSGENVRCYNLQLTRVPRVPTNTRLLDLRYNKIKSLSGGDFNRLSSLRTLLLQNNHIERIDSRTFQPLTHLQVLYLSDNSITTLSSNLFDKLRAVRIVHLDMNKISNVHEDTFKGMGSLTTLYLQNNNISLISSPTFSSLNKLTSLRLDGNPLFCDCRLGWATNYPPLNVGKSSLTCAQPPSLRGRLILGMKPVELGCSAPQANITRDHVTVTSQQNLMLHCMVTGEPRPLVSWTHNNAQISNTSRTQVMNNGTLLVMRVMPSDRGEYKCAAVNLMGMSVTSVLVSYLGDPVVPEITAHSGDTEVQRGNTVTLRCIARGHPLPTISWLKDGRLLSGDSRISQPTFNSLEVNNVQFTDRGSYTCQASNSEGVDQETMQLTVVSSPLIEHSSQTNTIADPGDDVVLVCRATGQPAPSLTWMQNGVQITGDSHRVISGDQLEIKQFRTSDEGSYSCVASNRLGVDERNFTIAMKRLQLPVFTSNPESQYILVENTLTLICIAAGAIRANQWTHNGTTLANRGRVSISRSGDKLTVRSVTMDDAGVYRCMATGNDGNTLSNPAIVMVTTDVISCDDISRKVEIQQIANEVDNAIRNTTDKMASKLRHSPSELLTLLRFPSSGTVDLAKAAEIFDEAIQRYESNYSVDTIVTGIPLHLSDCELTTLARLSGCVSHRPVPNCSDICYHRQYRTLDGTCNNIQHPLRGAAMTPFGRLLDSDYDNGLSLPRGWKRILPSPRLITQTALSSPGRLREDSDFTLMLMQIGQFLDHDLDIAPVTPSRESFAGGISCDETCNNTSPCFPIPVPRNDARIRNRECLPFTRSSAVCGTGASSLLVGRAAYRREQINQITSYVDASMIYGSSQETADLLRNRSMGKGMLRRGEESSPGNYYLPYDTTSSVDCDQGNHTGRSLCFLAGDVRVNEQVGLTTMHTIWYREHNRIADILSQLNPHWDEERLYQETRLIVTAQWQHVVFTEYVPKIVGSKQWQDTGVYTGYNDTVDASILNSFATAAFRFGHSQIMPLLLRLNETWQPTEHGPLALRNAFFAPHRIVEEGGIDPLLRGLMVEQSKERASDQALTNEIIEHLFQQANSVALDLGALNIQRGRDHGLPSYNKWREFCGLRAARDFRDLSGEISSAVVRKLELLYIHVEDIDLFVGGILEDLVSGGRLGPTFTCIIRTQFQRLRDGDRFYYEKPGLFTKDQLREIKKTSLAKVICTNADNIATVPSDVFVHQHPDQFVPCDQLDTPNLFYWKECTDCGSHQQRRDISPQVFDIGNTQINTAYEQLQNTVQLLSDKVADLEKKTCQFNGITYNEGEHWELPRCHACMCEHGEVTCEHISCDCSNAPSHECCPQCTTPNTAGNI